MFNLYLSFEFNDESSIDNMQRAVDLFLENLNGLPFRYYVIDENGKIRIKGESIPND